MKSFIRSLVVFAVFVFVAGVAQAQMQVSLVAGRAQSSISGLQRYSGNGQVLGDPKPNSFSSGNIIGVRVGYNFGRLIRAEARVSNISDLRGGSAGLFTMEDLSCVLSIALLNADCPEPDLSTRLVANDASIVVVGRTRAFGMEFYAGGGPMVRQSVLRTRGAQMTDVNFGGVVSAGVSRPIMRHISIFVEYNVTRVRGEARFNVERTGSLFVHAVSLRPNDQHFTAGITLR